MNGHHGVIPPVLDRDSAAWWGAISRSTFVLPKCASCGRNFFPPTPYCPHCGSPEVSLKEASGRGRIYSWIVVHRALHPAFADDIPYTIVAVDLDEGPRLAGRLLDGDPRDRGRVRVSFYQVDATRLVGFIPTDLRSATDNQRVG